MTNLEKYNQIFTKVFGVDTSVLNDNFSKDNIDAWDSVHQLNLVSLSEEVFDIMFDPEEIMAFTSYASGKKLMANQGIEI